MKNTISGETAKQLDCRYRDFEKYRAAGTKGRTAMNMKIRGFAPEERFLDSRYARYQYAPGAAAQNREGGNWATLGALPPHAGMSWDEFKRTAKHKGWDALPKHDLQNYWAGGQMKFIDEMRNRRVIDF